MITAAAVTRQEVRELREGEVVELEIPSAPEYVSVVRRAIEGIAQKMRFGAGQIEDLKLAVGEACTNAIKHGCPGQSAHGVAVRCMVCADALTVEIRNNVAGCAEPCVPVQPDLNREGGLGLFLMRHLMDEVHFAWQDHEAVVTMVKRLDPASA